MRKTYYLVIHSQLHIFHYGFIHIHSCTKVPFYHPPFLLLRQVLRALEVSSSERQHLLGFGREDSEWG